MRWRCVLGLHEYLTVSMRSDLDGRSRIVGQQGHCLHCLRQTPGWRYGSAITRGTLLHPAPEPLRRAWRAMKRSVRTRRRRHAVLGWP